MGVGIAVVLIITVLVYVVIGFLGGTLLVCKVLLRIWPPALIVVFLAACVLTTRLIESLIKSI